jgi:lipopolysaccharide exporter
MTSGETESDVQGGPSPNEADVRGAGLVDASLAGVAVGGAAWQGASYLLGKLLVLVTTVVLARVLVPSDFGVVGIALVFITYVEGVTDLGVAEALVYFPADRLRNDAAVTLSLIVSGLLTLAALLSAPLVARFFHRPDITTMIRVLSLGLLIRGAAEVPDALLRKELQFRRRLIADLARVLAQGAVSIPLALAGLGAWAIVYGYLAAGLVWGATAWMLIDYRPGHGLWRPSRAIVRPLLAYGLPAAGNVLLLSLVFDVDYLIVGRWLGATPLGYYTLAFRIPELAIINVFFVLSAVIFPIFSRAREDPERLRRGYLGVVRFQTLYGVTAGVGLAVVAPMFVRVAFGSKWDPAIVPLEALALYAAFRSIGIGAVDAYKAVGRPGLAMWLALARLAAVVPALLIATHFGIVGVSWAQAVVALILAVATQAVACAVLGLSPMRLASTLVPALAAGAGAVVGAGAVRLWLPGSDATRLAAGILAGGLGAALALRAADRSFFGDVRSLLRQRAAPSSAP